MLYEQSLKRHKVVTIDEIRRAPLGRAKAIDFERLQHCAVLLDMLKRIAYCYYKPCLVDINDVFRILNKHNWTCPTSHVPHSELKPLSLAFIVPIPYGGRIVPTNLKPKFYENRLAGAFVFEHQEQDPTPPLKNIWTGISFVDARAVWVAAEIQGAA